MTTVTKMKVSEASLARYQKQHNVIKKSGASTLNYGIIRIMTDMDPDGNDIQCLLLQFFSHWPDLFLQGRVKRLNTPLFVARKKGQATKYYYTAIEYEADKSKLTGWSVEYMKGLGSLIEEDYSFAINTPNDTNIVYDKDSRNSLDMAFGDNAQARKDWLLA